MFALSQQENAPAHCAGFAVELLYRATPQFISLDMWPANSSDLMVHYRIWGMMMQERVYRVPISVTIRMSCGSAAAAF